MNFWVEQGLIDVSIFAGTYGTSYLIGKFLIKRSRPTPWSSTRKSEMTSLLGAYSNRWMYSAAGTTPDFTTLAPKTWFWYIGDSAVDEVVSPCWKVSTTSNFELIAMECALRTVSDDLF